MQNKVLLAMLNQKTHIGLPVTLQGQNIVTCLKALQPCNNSGFHAYVRTEEEV